MSPLWLLLILLPILGGAERFNCKTRILGAYYPDTKSGCKAFHVCVRVAGGGIRDFRFFCPPGTLFHQEAQTCTDWGDDDPLACPAEIYDGQFDLYRIGSGFDTKKSSSSGNREDEAEYSLQQAETGDRRLSQSNIAHNAPASDLRAAHSSDFFTGRRDRGRDESVHSPQGPLAPQSQAPFSSQSPTAPSVTQSPPAPPRQSFRRPTTSKTTINQFTIPTSTLTPPKNPTQYETSKRKLTRKRPISTQNHFSPTTFAPYVPSEQTYSEKPQQNFNRRVTFQNRQTTPNLPPQFKEYKDEYVEVSKVSPKTNKLHSNGLTPSPLPQQTTISKYNKKEGEQYNYETLSTPGLNTPKDYRPFNIKNSFNVVEAPKESNFERNKNGNGNFHRRITTTTTAEYSVLQDDNTTPSYRNFNSVSYEPEKQNFVPHSKNNNYRNPTTTTSTTSIRSDHLTNLNTVAYNTNNAFNVQPYNFAESEEDDGQYRPPQGEDDGQYRPELYEKELLSGAHSINIAASGNRLLENKKSFAKSNNVAKQTVAPQPFQPAASSNLPAEVTRETEIYTTSQLPQTINTQRTFDYYKTYTTTSRPNDLKENNFASNIPARSTTSTPSISERRPLRPNGRPSTAAPVTVPPKPSSSSQPFTKPLNNKEDNSYDYAYYDSDTGFSEYDHNLEFGKTKTQV